MSKNNPLILAQLFMKSSSSRNFNVLLFFLLAAVCFVKFKFLNMPLFWDELGVYGQGAIYMAENKLSLMPNSMDPNISRGHPLLMFFLFGGVFKLFGLKLAAGHGLALIISVALLACTNTISKTFMSPLQSFLAALLVAVQPIFLAQSTLILPEVPLALLALLSIYFFSKKKILFYILCSCAAMMIKETAIIIPVIAIVTYTAARILTNKSVSYKWYQLLLLFTSWLLYYAFLLVQEAQLGWKFFPYHVSFVDTSWPTIWFKIKFFGQFIFVDQGRWLWSLLFIAGTILLAVNRDLKNLFNGYKGLFRLAISITCFGMFLFCILNPDVHRYIMLMIPLLAIATVQCTFYAIKKWRLSMILIIPLMVLPFLSLKNGEFKYDVDYDYLDLMEMNIKTAQELEKLNLHDADLFASFPTNLSIYNPAYGYVEQGFDQIFNKDPEIMIFSNPGGNYLLLPASLEFTDTLIYNAKNEAFVCVVKRDCQ